MLNANSLERREKIGGIQLLYLQLSKSFTSDRIKGTFDDDLSKDEP